MTEINLNLYNVVGVDDLAAARQLEKEGYMLTDLTNIAKPCPMCGSKHISMIYPKIKEVYRVHILCADCGLNGYQIVFQDVDINDAMERTIKYWNTRV